MSTPLKKTRLYGKSRDPLQQLHADGFPDQPPLYANRPAVPSVPAAFATAAAGLSVPPPVTKKESNGSLAPTETGSQEEVVEEEEVMKRPSAKATCNNKSKPRAEPKTKNEPSPNESNKRYKYWRDAEHGLTSTPSPDRAADPKAKPAKEPKAEAEANCTKTASSGSMAVTCAKEPCPEIHKQARKRANPAAGSCNDKMDAAKSAEEGQEGADEEELLENDAPDGHRMMPQRGPWRNDWFCNLPPEGRQSILDGLCGMEDLGAENIEKVKVAFKERRKRVTVTSMFPGEWKRRITIKPGPQLLWCRQAKSHCQFSQVFPLLLRRPESLPPLDATALGYQSAGRLHCELGTNLSFTLWASPNLTQRCRGMISSALGRKPGK